MVCGSYSVGDTGLAVPFSRGLRRGEVDGIDVIELQVAYSNKLGFVRRALSFLLFALRSAKVALTQQHDLVFATSTPLTVAIPGLLSRWFRRKPFVFEVRDLWPELPQQMGVIRNPVVLLAMRVLEKAAYRNAAACIGLAPGIVDGIIAGGGDARSTVMIPNGCDLALFRPAQRSRTCDEIMRVVFTGTHGIANGLDAVLDAAAVLRQRGRDDIRIEFVGDGALKATLMERAHSDSLANCVFRDPLPRQELANDLPTIHVGLQVLANFPGFYFGTSPNKFFDYLASGVAVLTNYPGWVANMVEEYECGVAVPADNPVAFADALEYLADEPDKQAEMGINARSLAETQFDRVRLADAFVATLETAGRR
jgi:glycosyltransferase involved in cell wall biosynthesis